MSGWAREDRLSERLGVARETLRKMRSEGVLVEGKHWRLRSNRIELSAEGVEVVAGMLGVDGPVDDACLAVVLWEQPKRIRVRVARVMRSRHIVMAAPVVRLRDGFHDQGLIRLRVPDARKLCRDLVVDAEHVAEDLWELVGRAPCSKRQAARLAMMGE